MFPFLSAITGSIALILDKMILQRGSMSGKTFTSTLFIFMGLFSLPLLYFFEVTRIDFYSISILFTIILLSGAYSSLLYISLNHKNLSTLEPIRNAEPIVTMLLAFSLFSDERNIAVLFLGCITTLSLIYVHTDFKKFKIVFDRYAYLLILVIIIGATLSVIYKVALDFVNPVTLYTIRILGISILLYFLFQPKLKSLQRPEIGLFGLSAIFYSLSAILQYSAIAHVGLNITILIISLSPIIIYLASYFILREEVTYKQIISSIIIILCVCIALFFG